MTIQTLTSNPSSADLPVNEANGVLDLASLGEIANAFFRALPGETPVTPSKPSLHNPSIGADSGPQLSPAVQGQTASAPVSSRTEANAFGPSDTYVAAIPQVSAVQPSAPVSAEQASPYYFASEGNQYQSLAQPALVDKALFDWVAPQSFGLPGDAEIRALLGGKPTPAAPAGFTPTHKDSAFYFVDDVPKLYAEPRQAQVHQHKGLDVEAIRKDFPILAERVNGKPLVWLDNAATTQKPKAVIDRLQYFYEHENSNIHRAAHELAARATDAYEAARDKVAKFIGAKSTAEIVFVRGATEAINLVARTFGQQEIGAGDEIIVSNLEHHANIVPWQMLASEKGAKLRVIPVDDSGQILLDEYRKLLNARTKLVAITQVSNALGTITPVKEIIDLAHAVGARVLVDGAQSVSHIRVNVQALDADFFVFSGHKIFGPTGIGVVYGKQDLLNSLPPYQGGGNMIADVTFEKTLYHPAPARFEAGTGNIADAVGLGAALDYLNSIGIERVAQYEHDLLHYATHGLKSIPGLRLIGTATNKTSVLSFVLAGYKPEEVGAALNQEGIAVRSGHHCAQPILRRFGVEATVRPSIAFYNTCEEVDKLVNVVHHLARKRG